MQRHIVFLRPKGAQSCALTSHTLFGATCWALATLGEDVGRLLSNFPDASQRFAFSAPFPYIRDKNTKPVLLLPRPPFRVPGTLLTQQAQTDQALEEAYDLAKNIQKARYISQGITQQLQTGQWKPQDVLNAAYTGNLKKVGNSLFLKEEVQALWAKRVVQELPWKRIITTRNSVDRLAGATVQGLLFQQEEYLYNAQLSGIWFGVWADKNIWPKIEAAFRYLQDTGIGGKRAIGKGHFDFEISDWDSIFPQSNTQHCKFLNLSYYIQKNSSESTPIAYTLDTIRQKASNRFPLGEQRVYMAVLRAFAPGGIFKASESQQTLYGQLQKLGQVNNRTVYYNGLTLPLWGDWEV